MLHDSLSTPATFIAVAVGYVGFSMICRYFFLFLNCIHEQVYVDGNGVWKSLILSSVGNYQIINFKPYKDLGFNRNWKTVENSGPKFSLYQKC